MNQVLALEGIDTEGWTEEEITRAYERQREQELERLQREQVEDALPERHWEGAETVDPEQHRKAELEEDVKGERFYGAKSRSSDEDLNLPLFSKLLLGQKFLILALLAGIMVAIPFGLYLLDAKKTVDATVREAQGVEPVLNILKLLQLTQQHRTLSASALAGNAEDSASRAAKNKEIAEAMMVIDASISKDINHPTVAKDWMNAKSHWQALLDKIKGGTLSATNSTAEHTKLLGEYTAVIDQIADKTGLDLDPEAASYYMMRAGLHILPQLTEALERFSDIGIDLLTSKQADPVKMAMASSYLSVAKSNQKEGFDTLQKALDNDQMSKDAIQSNTTRTLNKVIKNIRTIEAEIIGKSTFNYDVDTFKNEMSDLLIDLNLLNKTALGQLKTVLDTRKTKLFKELAAVAGGILGLALVSLLISYYISRSITEPVSHLVGVMQQLAAGDSTVRANIKNIDEIGELSRQFDTMVDQRESASAMIREENEKLNSSIVNLLQAVAGLAQRDLTIKAPVAEDITGPVGDALNYLSDETSKVLNKVVQIADEVAHVSEQVRAKADTVIQIAGEENREVELSAVELSRASEVMLDIARLALSCNEAASKAIQKTDRAQVTVLSTVQGITSIRDTIRETEKRIKRLGERSQEIGSIITIINGIAERTHILALNASMHAASAGEAGKGFAVVANEVQKLAENAREATQQISNLVNNIQVETADTVTTMNEAITQVVEGTTLAQQAGSEMRETRETTAELVSLVERIAENSRAQAETTQKIRERSMMIQKSSAETFHQLKEQGLQTEKLVQYSGSLVQSVGVFTLPKPEQIQVEAA